MTPPLGFSSSPGPTCKPPHPHLCEHDQPDEEGGDRHPQNEDLPAVLLAEHTGIHVHQCRHQAFHTHELDERARSWRASAPPPPQPRSSINQLWLIAPGGSPACLLTVQSAPCMVGVGSTLQNSPWSLEGHRRRTCAQPPAVLRAFRASRSMLGNKPAASHPQPTHTTVSQALSGHPS